MDGKHKLTDVLKWQQKGCDSRLRRMQKSTEWKARDPDTGRPFLGGGEEEDLAHLLPGEKQEC